MTARERQIVQAFIAAASALETSVDSALIQQLIRQGSASALDTLDTAGFISALEPMVQAIQAEVAAGGLLGIGELPSTISGAYRFDVLDPRAIAWAEARAGQLITQVTDEQRLLLNRTLARSIENGWTVAQTTQDLRQVIGLHDAWANAVSTSWDREYARLLSTGMSEALARQQANAFAERYRNRLLDARAKNIARTEILTASNQGRWLSWAQGVEGGYISKYAVKEWTTGPLVTRPGKRQVCELCSGVRGETRFWNEEFSIGVTIPPAHPSCRCTAVLVPASIKDVQSRLDQADKIEAERGRVPQAGDYAYADRAFLQASQIEPDITDAMKRLANDNEGQLYGLDYRLKERNSLAAKIARDRYRDPLLSYDDALVGIRDSVRYTMVMSPYEYGVNAQNVIDTLRLEGKTVTVKNYWGKYGDYNGINCQVFDPDLGTWYELQFHTEQSYEIKEALHKLYEQARQTTDPIIQAELNAQMIEITNTQRIPVDARMVKVR